jgi:hypothetical protein
MSRWSGRIAVQLALPGVLCAQLHLPAGNSAVRPLLQPASEFGTVPRFAFVAASLFF